MGMVKAPSDERLKPIVTAPSNMYFCIKIPKVEMPVLMRANIKVVEYYIGSIA
jgi:hypothetical protein